MARDSIYFDPIWIRAGDGGTCWILWDRGPALSSAKPFCPVGWITRQGSREANGRRMDVSSGVNSMAHVRAGYVLVG